MTSFLLTLQRPDFGKLIAQYKRGEIPPMQQVKIPQEPRIVEPLVWRAAA
jgi:hypothetical protein